VLGDDFGKDLVAAPSNVSCFLSSRVLGRGRSGKPVCGDVVLLHNPSEIKAAAAAATAIIIDVFITFLAGAMSGRRVSSFKVRNLIEKW
jgi:hypothetical protein